VGQDESRRPAPVWDLPIRVGHWTLAAGVAAAWLTKTGAGRWHEWVGYATLALVALRIAWGFAGPRYARFGQFVRSPAATLAYAARVLGHGAPRYLGHNPLGGWMIVTLLAAVAATGVTGWLYTTDRFWGVEWMENLHEACAILVLVLVTLHVTGVIVASLRHRENLVAAMIHGRKRPPVGDDVA
jgi:cytochrome b